MAEVRKCPECGVLLPAGVLSGLCPACLLKQGAATDSATQPAQPRFEPPPVAEVARLFPQLEILELIGKGGMGAVYKARQPALDRFVALKLLPAQPSGGAGFTERFNREARALAKLSHPNIVAVHEFGVVSGVSSGGGTIVRLSHTESPDANPGGKMPSATAGGTPAATLFHFFIMEFVDGVNLRQLQKAGRLSPREALQIIPQLCDALQYAHDEGVVHRDIKPENVLIDRKGRVKIADFGLAKILNREPEDLRLTGEGQVMGTPHYMAPEQIEHPLTVDHRADIFSLGVIFYEMLTGELPLGKFPPPSRKVRVDVRLDEVVLRALEKEPELRYQQASEVKTAVENIERKPGEFASRPNPPSPALKSRVQVIWKIAAVLAAVVMLILAVQVGMLVLAIVMPAWHRSSEPRFVLSGTVTDAVTGKPIRQARVADNYYNTRPNRAPQESWTDNNGHYELKTWYEEHTVAASAPGYETTLATLMTKTFGREDGKRMDFQLRRMNVEMAAKQPTDVPGQTLDSLPPVVVETKPMSGAHVVNPGLSEITVRFSKDMADGTWSWSTAWLNSTPDIIAGPKYAPDRRTCTITVKLEAGKTYAYWLNSENFHNFQDQAGHPAIPYLLIFQTSGKEDSP